MINEFYTISLPALTTVFVNRTPTGCEENESGTTCRSMKDNALRAIGQKRVPHLRHVLKDKPMELRGLKATGKCPYPLRHLKVEDLENSIDCHVDSQVS